MKKIYKVETNASTMFVTYDEEDQIVRVLDNEETNGGIGINEVEDDSSWEMFTDVENLEEWLGVDYNDSDSPRITDEAEFN